MDNSCRQLNNNNKKMHLALENLCVASRVCVCVCVVPKELLLLLLLGAGGEYVTRNDELLAGDARQALMRDDSVKLDKRIWARGSWAEVYLCVCACMCHMCVCVPVWRVDSALESNKHCALT